MHMGKAVSECGMGALCSVAWQHCAMWHGSMVQCGMGALRSAACQHCAVCEQDHGSVGRCLNDVQTHDARNDRRRPVGSSDEDSCLGDGDARTLEDELNGAHRVRVHRAERAHLHVPLAKPSDALLLVRLGGREAVMTWRWYER